MTTGLPGTAGQATGWPLAVFRMAFGLLYLDMALQKAPWVRDGAGRRFGWLAGFIEKEIAYPAFPAVAAVLRDVVLPHFWLFGTVAFLVELALGAGLLAGILTRLLGTAGCLWQVSIAVQAYRVPGEWPWIWVLLTLPQFCFAASRAGRVLGADAWLVAALAGPASRGRRWARVLQALT